MGADYQRWLMAKGSYFSPSAASIVKLILRLRAEEWIVASGGREVELDVVDRETPAVRLYERAGYRPDGRREPASEPGATELGMQKTLAVPP